MRARRRAASDRLLSGLSRLAKTSPKLAYETSAALDRLRHGNRPTDPYRLRNFALRRALLGSHPEPFPWVHGDPMRSLPDPPAVLVTFHNGGWQAIGWLGLQHHGRLFTLTQFDRRRGVSVECFSIGADGARRTMGMKLALDALRSGRFVVLAMDDTRSATLPVTMFGRSLELTRGAFTLARLAQVPMVPVAARWHGAKIVYTIGDPIQAAEESVMANAVARWFEDYLSRYPW